ncbi:hypothetical protein MSG28_003428 [Choristoneura fumiferana]|uniref:Uncharacterized protein n=2 Tax=Choristoneura fumiferana TaxID=7141 RepID=A0ACC0KEQ8_CHOFU|nr:hypothetical protein MSG28_003428 [Choristoneura fumiferana]KAI8434974.1 hypothetical protein MSG28_003428 [Choristoneura fumiferana]
MDTICKRKMDWNYYSTSSIYATNICQATHDQVPVSTFYSQQAKVQNCGSLSERKLTTLSINTIEARNIDKFK